MTNKLYVGSLAYSVNDAMLKAFFDPMGTVTSAQVIIDRGSNQSKGFGFVEMSTNEEAQKAIKELNDKELEGRSIVVSEARPKEDRQNSYGGGVSYNRNPAHRRY